MYKKTDTKKFSDSFPITEEQIWTKIEMDMKKLGIDQARRESLLSEWKLRYKLALKSWFDNPLFDK